MSTVFIGGSRRISRLPVAVRRRLENIVGKRLTVLVGDANGADKAVQAFLHERKYEDVVVFCTGDQCRNNVGRWPVRRVQAEGVRKGTRAFYTLKDRAMTEEATVGFMLWDGESQGTLANVLRLLHLKKKVVLFRSDRKDFVELADLADWSSLSIPTELRSAIEEDARGDEAQRGLF